MYKNLHEVPEVVKDLIKLCTLHKVDFERGDEYDPSEKDRLAVSKLEDANAISSSTAWNKNYTVAVLLDIDGPAALLKSSTKGHGHFYAKLPSSVPTEKYIKFLEAAADIGLIQEGYAHASKGRGYSTLRLPWVRKDNNNDN